MVEFWAKLWVRQGVVLGVDGFSIETLNVCWSGRGSTGVLLVTGKTI